MFSKASSLGRPHSRRYNARVDHNPSRPDPDRIGVLTAAVLLAFAVTRLLPDSAIDLRLTLGPFFLIYPLNLTSLITLLAGGLTAAGMDWLLRAHPSLNGQPSVEHWLLPTLSIFVVGLPLGFLQDGNTWWIAFGIAAVLLVVVFISEYVAVDPASASYPSATAILTSLSFAIYLILLVAVRLAGMRLVVLAPAIFIVSGLLALRVLRLRLHGQWKFVWALGIALISIQLAAGLHYWPLSPIQFALALLGPMYALISLAGNLGESAPIRRAAIEPIIAVSLAWASALILA